MVFWLGECIIEILLLGILFEIFILFVNFVYGCGLEVGGFFWFLVLMVFICGDWYGILFLLFKGDRIWFKLCWIEGDRIELMRFKIGFGEDLIIVI